jgi:DsbC/DsbD-like thiol-disulfide interchange protein
MTTMFRIAPAVFFLILSLFPAFGQTQPSSSWVQGLHSRVRLVSGGQAGGQWLAGVEIALDSGFKTYWRTPGESGLPPRFDWTASDNVASVDVLWPAPARHEDAGGVAYVYSQEVVLPVRVTPKDSAKPVRLDLSVDYGVCKDICIPARAELTTVLSGDGAHQAMLEKALAEVPRPQALGAKADLSVVSLEPQGQGKPGFIATISAPSGTRPALFAEGPENWYLSTSLPDGANRFTITIEDKPKDASGPVPVRLTLVAGGQAIETEASLDDSQPPR